MDKHIKRFKIFCHLDEEKNPVIHEITMTENGAVHLHGHPELQSEVYYNLLMIQKEKGEGKQKYSYRGWNYEVKGCLQFYFSLIHGKFEKYINDIEFETKDKDNPVFYRCDNHRLAEYLELIKRKTAKRERFDRESVWSEAAFYENNQQKLLTKRDDIFKQQFIAGVERFERYSINLDFSVKDIIVPKKTRNSITTSKYYFQSALSSRCSTSRSSWRRNPHKTDGCINIVVEVTKDWFKDINRNNIAVINSKNHGKLFVITAEPNKTGYLVDAVVCSSGTQIRYIIQKYQITKNVVTGEWEAQRKNKVRNNSDATLTFGT